jgi:hypothetical protein
MIRFLIAILVIVMAFVNDASACSCVERSLAKHAKTEKRVFLARAGAPVKTGDALEQKFTILSTFKGPHEKEFTLNRAATPPCVASYAENELAIIFTSSGDVDPCHGNQPFATQADELFQILQATNVSRKAGDAAALELALRTSLVKFLHARSRIPVRHAPLAGKSFDIDKSKLVYTTTKSKDGIEITNAVTAGNLTSVRGNYKREGVVFSVVLLRGADNTWTVIHSSVVET